MMSEVTVQPTAVELFDKWLKLLNGGTLTTATFVAGEHAELVDPLQRLINGYIAERAANVEDTLTAVGEPCAAESPPALPGFTMLGVLGEGGMGVVYRVRDALDRELALKMVRHGQLTESGHERFLDEAKAMARLDHPHVAPVIYLDTSPTGRPYFVMPIYPSSLNSRLAEYQSDPAKAVRLMAAVAEGVAHLHAKGFIHRDLKPHNILIDADGQPAVSDFGLVKCLSDSTPEPPTAPVTGGSGETKPSGARRSKTVIGAAMGTRAYMAPEQAAGLTHLANPRWDVWSLGVILHELLTGERPPSSLAPDGLLDPRAPDNPAPSTLKPGLDQRLERIIQRSVARSETNRYASASELSHALRAWLARDTARPRRIRWLYAILACLIVLTAGVVGVRELLEDSSGSARGPDAAKLQFLEALANREPLELITPGKLPPYYEIRSLREFTNLSTRSEHLEVGSLQTALVELVPPGAPDRELRIRAVMRFEHGVLDDGEAGLFFGSDWRAMDGRPTAICPALLVTERLGPHHAGEAQGQCGIVVRHYADELPAERNLGPHSTPAVVYFDVPKFVPNTPEPWRTIDVELTADRIRFHWTDDMVREVTHEALNRQLAQRYRALVPPPRFRPEAGIGLLVRRASVSFRSISVEPPGRKP